MERDGSMAPEQSEGWHVRDSERNARELLDSVPGLVALLTITGEVEFVNRHILEYTGQTLDELKHWGTNGTVHAEDLPHVAQVFGHSIGSGSPYEIVQRLRRSDGVYRWFQNNGFPLRDAAGGIVRWCVLLTDIDERKRAEDALRDSERESRLIVDSIPGLVATFNPAGEVEFVNRQTLEYFGKTPEDHRNWGSGGMTHPEDLPRAVEIFTRSIASGAPFDFEVRARRSDGVYRWFQSRGYPLRDVNGDIVRWYNLLIDIDERKRAEVELRRAYDSFADAQRLSKTGSFITDLVRDQHSWSEETYRIFEFEPGSRVTLQRIRAAIHPDDLPSFESMLERAMSGVDVDFSFRIVSACRDVKHVRGIAHVGEQVEGRPLFVGALQDVTENMVAEAALNKARADLAHVARVTTASALTASIAHEINQPLSGIMTNAGTCVRMLAATPPDIDGARETARRMIRDGSRAADVMTRLRGLFSKKEFLPEPLDLNDVAREVIALSLSELHRQRIVLKWELAGELPPVPGDRIQIQQVVLNLLRNATDAMADVHDRPRHLLIKTDRDSGDRVRLSIRDAGGGLPPDMIGQLFDAFYTTKSDGMGIGLYVSRTIIERHRGRLWAEPNDGPGATFSFSIPATE